jgi:flagella basal body P-ring formation protein FlgA
MATMRQCLSCVLTALLLALSLPPQGRAQSAKQAVREAAMQVLSTQYPESAAHLEVQVRRIRGGVDPAEEVRLEFSDREGRPTGLAQVDLRTREAGGDWTKAGWALLQVARLDSVVTLQGRARRGETIPRSNLETAWIETTDLHGEPLRADTVHTRAARGALVATRHLRSGRVLRAQDVRRPYTTDTGSAIRVQYQEGRLIFRLSCTAREPGFVDEVIRVHCPDLNTMYRARVTDEGTAQWIETL